MNISKKRLFFVVGVLALLAAAQVSIVGAGAMGWFGS